DIQALGPVARPRAGEREVVHELVRCLARDLFAAEGSRSRLDQPAGRVVAAFHGPLASRCQLPGGRPWGRRLSVARRGRTLMLQIGGFVTHSRSFALPLGSKSLRDRLRSSM